MPLLGITPSGNTQLQNRNMPEDIADILGTRAFQRYMDTPLQTLDGIIVNQPKHFLPLAKEAKRIVEEIRIEKINEQWAGIVRFGIRICQLINIYCLRRIVDFYSTSRLLHRLCRQVRIFIWWCF